MILVSFNGTDQRVKQRITDKPAKIQNAVRAALDLSMLDLQRRIQQKLSGEVLQNRGGTLLNSIRKDATVASAGKIEGGVQGGAGLAQAYASVHEFGGKESYEIKPVNKKALAFAPTGSAFEQQAGSSQRAFRFQQGKRRGSLRPKLYGAFHAMGGVVVKSVIHPPLMKRSFMNSSLEEKAAQIREKVFAAAAKAATTE